VSCTERRRSAVRTAWFVRVVLGTLVAAHVACESSALSLSDPNEVNAEIEPPFIANDETRVSVTIRFLDESPSASGAGNTARTTPLVLSADFGTDIASNNWMFEDDFVVRMDLTRYADTAVGERPFTVRIFNGYGTFVARGRLTVY
jgi:hypothetical protein